MDRGEEVPERGQVAGRNRAVTRNSLGTRSGSYGQGIPSNRESPSHVHIPFELANRWLFVFYVWRTSELEVKAEKATNQVMDVEQR